MLGSPCSPCCPTSICGAGSFWYGMTVNIALTNIRPDLTGISKLDASRDWLDKRGPLETTGRNPDYLLTSFTVWGRPTGNPPDNFFENGVDNKLLWYQSVEEAETTTNKYAPVRFTRPVGYRFAEPGQCLIRYDTFVFKNNTTGYANTLSLVRPSNSPRLRFVVPAHDVIFLPSLDATQLLITGQITGFCNFFPPGATPPSSSQLFVPGITNFSPYVFHAQANAIRMATGFGFATPSPMAFNSQSVTQVYMNQNAPNLFASASTAGSIFNWLYDMTVTITI